MAIRINIIANFAGRGWQALLSLAVVPVYLHLLGTESYGLIGFFASLQALISLLDLGLGGGLCRELARSTDSQHIAYRPRDIVRTLEVVYWGIGITACAVMFLLAPYIAKYWLKAEQLGVGELQHVLIYMVLAIAIQWPSSLYISGLMGLQRQVLMNVVGIVSSTVRMVGSVLVIWLIEPSVEVFFLWQIVASIFQTGVSALFLWKNIPESADNSGPKFSKDAFRHVWRFAGSLSATSVVIVLLGQVDKLMVSAILPLRIFGFYMLANTIAQSLNLLPAPIVDAMFPRFSQLVAQDNVGELARLFNKSCQLLFGLVLPMAAVLAFYAHDVLWLWTKDPLIAQQASKIATVLIIGVALNTVMSTMDTLLMAFGWMKPAFYSRLAALLGITPVMWFLCHRYGALGAASAWLIVFAGYLCVTPFFVFSKILPQEKTAWYVNWLRALLITFVTAGISFYAFPHAGTRSILFVEILLVMLGVFLVNAICTPTYRNLLRAALP